MNTTHQRRRPHPAVLAVLVALPLAGCAGVVFTYPGVGVSVAAAPPVATYFEVSASDAVRESFSTSGRLFVFVSSQEGVEPRLGTHWVEQKSEPFFAVDVTNWDGRRAALVDDRVLGFPLAHPSDLPPGTYWAQALYRVNTLSSELNAPGNMYGPTVRFEVKEYRNNRVRLELDSVIPPETLPPDTDLVKLVKIPSALLSEFWGAPMFLRAAVILPRGYAGAPDRRYPVRYHIGGFHARYTHALEMMAAGAAFRTQWLADDTPRMILVHLDGEAPFGDPYQVDSANNGPYGQALTDELIPYIDEHFRTIAEPRARFVDGGSTGGWVSLALQILHPDLFNGAWSFCPDSVDFRYLQLINLYDDDNAFYNRYGYERPSMRDPDGEPRFSIRAEVWMEQVLGRGDTFTTSGGQWGSWAAVYGPRGDDGLPAAPWDSATGEIDHEVGGQWLKYDLRHQLQQHWSELGPELAGKLHIWVGDMDSFYLNDAVGLLAQFLAGTEDPASDAQITFGPGQPHCWEPLSEPDIMRGMLERMGEGGGPGETQAQR